MIYRIEYENARCYNYANGRADLLKQIDLLKDEKIVDIRKVYKSGATDSVLDTYKRYIER